MYFQVSNIPNLAFEKNHFTFKNFHQNYQIFRHDKLLIDDHVYIYNDQEHRIERLPVTVTTGTYIRTRMIFF